MKNATVVDSKNLTFEIWAKNNSTTAWSYATGQYYLNYNNRILNSGNGTLSIIDSDLPSNLRPINPNVSTSASGFGQLTFLANLDPGIGNYYPLGPSSEVKILKASLTTDALGGWSKYTPDLTIIVASPSIPYTSSTFLNISVASANSTALVPPAVYYNTPNRTYYYGSDGKNPLLATSTDTVQVQISVRNVVQTASNKLTFDIYIKNTGITTYKYYTAQYYLYFNKNILNGGAGSLKSITSALPVAYQPRNPIVSTTSTPGQLTVSPNASPGLGTNYPMNIGEELLVTRLELSSSSTNFAPEKINLQLMPIQGAGVQLAYEKSDGTADISLKSSGVMLVTDLSNLFDLLPSINVTVQSPAGNEQWGIGTVHNITWNSSNITNVKLEYSSDNGTNWNSIIASTPASTGSYAWTVPSTPSSQYLIRISDASNSSLYSLSGLFTVFQPTINITSPIGGENWIAGSAHNITWTSSNVTNIKLEYSSDNGTNWTTIIASTAASAGSYSWTIPSAASTQYLVRVSDASNSSLNSVSNVFSVLAPILNLTSPIGGENWLTGSTHNISWSSSNIINVKIECTTNNGADWLTVTSGVDAALGIYAWTLPNTASTQCKIRISNVSNSSTYSISSSTFTISTPSSTEINSIKSGLWSDPTIWSTNTVPSGSEIITIQSTDSITVDFPVTITNKLISVSGRVGIGILGSLTFASGSIYEHAADGGNVPTSTWNTGSTLLLTGIVSNSPYFSLLNCNQDYDNIIWNCPNYTTAMNFGMGGNTIKGNFRMIKSSSINVPLRLTSNWVGNTAPGSNIITLDGNLTLEDTTCYFTTSGSAGIDTITFVIKGNIVSKGKISLGQTSGGMVNWFVAGDVFLNAGTFTTHSAIAYPDSFIFNGTIKQTFNKDLSVSDAWYIHFAVRSGATVDFNNSSLGAVTSITCTIPTGATIWTSHEKGFGGNFNNLGVTTLSTGASYVYNGQTAQLDSLLPASVKNLTIDNPMTVSFSKPIIVTGVLTLKNGTLINNVNSITIASGGSVVFAGGNTSVPISGWPNPNSTISITSPVGGENWLTGSSHNITWTSSNVTNVKIEYSSDNGTSWTTIVASTIASGGIYPWTVPLNNGTVYKIRISDVSNSSLYSVSNVFTISTQNLTLTSPIGGENWLAGSSHNITWTSSTVSNIKIESSSDNGNTWSNIISSTTASTGSYSWTLPTITSSLYKVRISDALYPTINSVSSAFTISAQSLSVTSPVGGEQWQVASQHNITWTSSFVDSIKIQYSTDNGTNWLSVVSSMPAAAGSYSWMIPNTASTNCKVKISDISNSSLSSISPAIFTITIVQVPIVNITSPSGSELWKIGSSQNITWTSSNVANVKIEYSTNGGADWQAVVSSTAASTGSYPWTIPNTVSTQCKIKISDVLNSSTNSTSGTFTIYQPILSITAPAGSEQWQVGSQHNITWTSSYVNFIKIEYTTNNGTDWQTTAPFVAASIGSYPWTLPLTASTQCKVRVSDTSNSALNSVSGTFTVYQQSLSLTSPTGGEQWLIGSIHNITWSSSYVANVKMEYSSDNGTNWVVITSSTTASSNSFAWTVPTTPSTQHKVRVSDATNSSLNSVSGSFTIYQPTLTITSPVGGELWLAGSQHNITWTSTYISKIKIEYSTNNGTNWLTANSTVSANSGSYNWNIPTTTSAQYKVRISDTSNSTLTSVSGTFTVYKPTLTLTSPLGDELWLVGSQHNITWTSTYVSNIKIEYSIDNGSNWQDVVSSVTASSGVQVWTVPGNLSKQCKIKISDANNSSLSSISVNTFTIFDYPPTINIATTVTYVGEINPAYYRIVSIPGNVNIPIGQIVSGTQKKDWNAYFDNGASSNFLVEYDASSTFNFKPGKAFWLLSKNSLSIPSSSVGNLTIDSTTNTCSVDLAHVGWIMIGSPFLKVVDWTKILSLNSITTNTLLYTFSNGSFSTTTQMKPFEGYYFYNSSLSTLKFPYNPNLSSANKVVREPYMVDRANSIRFSIASKDKEFSTAYAALDSTSTNDYEIHDYFAPPEAFETADIRFYNNDIAPNYKFLAVDSRSITPSSGQKYDLRVKNNSGSQLIFKHDVLPERLNGYDILLVDEKYYKVYDLRKTESINIPASNVRNNYKLIIGSKEYSSEALKSLVPSEYQLFQNYPNPFNPVTQITYCLPEAGYITLKVFNILGKEIATLADGYTAAGAYTFNFNAVNLPSGVYFCSLNCGSKFTSNKKMILLK